MRIHAAVQISTNQWTLSNAFSSPNAVTNWIETQKDPKDYQAITTELPDHQWMATKNKLDYLCFQTGLDQHMYLPPEVNAVAQGEAQAEVQDTPQSAAPLLPESEVENYQKELASLMERGKKFTGQLEEVVKAGEVDGDSLVSAKHRALTGELDGIQARIAYIEAQIAPYVAVEDQEQEDTPPPAKNLQALLNKNKS